MSGNTSSYTQPSRIEVEKFKSKNRAIAYSIFIFDITFYLVTLHFAVETETLWLAVIFSLANGLGIGFLFLVGHDACHRSYLPTKMENYWVGQIAFLPSLTPFSLWDLGHNRIHHRYTNLSPDDYSYCPLSLNEYKNLSWFGKTLYRFHRTFPGHVTYYLIDIWWRKLFFPRKKEVGTYEKGFLFDHLVVLLWMALLLLYLVMGHHGIIRSFFLGFGLPFLVWGFLVSFVIYLQHTHPNIRWYKNTEEWNYNETSIQNTVYVTLPLGVNILFHRIMEHNAHHYQPGIPFYRLLSAQKIVARDSLALSWNLLKHLRICRTCKLYDFDRHRWVDYKGTPLSARTEPLSTYLK